MFLSGVVAAIESIPCRRNRHSKRKPLRRTGGRCSWNSDSVRPVGGLIRFSAPRLIGATVTPLNARLGDFPIHVAAQIGGNTAQLHVQPVAGAAAGGTGRKFKT